MLLGQLLNMSKLLVFLLCSLSGALSAQYLSDLQEEFDYYQRVVDLPSSGTSSITPETFQLLNELETTLSQRDTARFEAEDWLLYEKVYLAIAEMPADYRTMGRLEALAYAISATPKHWPVEKEATLSNWWYYSRYLLSDMNTALEAEAYQQAATQLIILSEIQHFLQKHPNEQVQDKLLGPYADWLGGELSRLYANLAKHFRTIESYEMAADMLNYGHHFYSDSRLIQEELVSLYLATEQVDWAKLHLSILIRSHQDIPAEVRKRWYFQRGTLYLRGPVDYGIAQRSFEEALSLDPQYFEALFNMAQVYIAQSNVALQAWEAEGPKSDAYKQQYYQYLREAHNYLQRAQKIRDTAQVQRLLEQTKVD